MSFFISARKGQSALEFLVLIGFALILISALLVVFQNRVSDMEAVREEAIVNQMFNLIFSEFEFAVMSRAVYNRTFYLPHTLGGHAYTLELVEDRDVVLSYLGKEHVRFLKEDYFTGDFSAPGENVIIKNSTNHILLNP